MNFGQNLYNWFLSNAQSLVLMAIVVIGIYLGFKREFSKLIGFLVVALIAVEEYQVLNDDKIIIFTGSKVTGGFCVTTYPLLSKSKLSHILHECPQLEKI